ncbi:MAG: helix-turn-helix domain-containing protein [Bacteroidota bacterium]
MKSRKSIAVLPFTNMSADGENDFFCDGITEEIIDAMSKISGLKVISRTSSFFFKNHQTTLQEISEKLQVSNLLEGSVRIANDVMRIKAQLINVEEDEVFWADSWDRKKENLFKIQDEISLLIAEKMREHYGHMDIQEQLVHTGTNNLSAYEHLLKGRHHFRQWNPEDVNKSITHFETATDLDNQLIDAFLGLADAYSFMAVAGFAPREEAWVKSIENIQKAKSLNEHHEGLNFMLANQSFFTAADYNGAMKHILRSVSVKPTYPDAQHFLSFLYMLRGEMTKAKEHLFFSKSIDPLNPETKFYEAYFLYRNNDYNGSLQLIEELLNANDKNLPAILIHVYVLIKLKRLDDAANRLKEIKVETFTPDERLGLSILIEVLKGNASHQLEQLEKNAKEPSAHQAHAYLFLIYVNLGLNDKAFHVLDQVFISASPVLLLVFGDPLASKIREDERWLTYHSKIYHVKQESSTVKKSKSARPDEPVVKDQIVRLTTHVETERPFLNPALSLRSLAGQIEIHPNQLSWLLNDSLGKNFNEFINHHRIAHFKKLILDPDNSHISIIGLAYESGFNSKTVFNTAFKKEVGMTPKEFQKRQS